MVLVLPRDVRPGETMRGAVGNAGELPQLRPRQATTQVQGGKQATHPLASRVAILIRQANSLHELVIREVVRLPVEQRRKLCQPVRFHKASLWPAIFE